MPLLLSNIRTAGAPISCPPNKSTLVIAANNALDIQTSSVVTEEVDSTDM